MSAQRRHRWDPRGDTRRQCVICGKRQERDGPGYWWYPSAGVCTVRVMRRCGECADCQEDMLSPGQGGTCAEVLEACRYFGAECQANPGSSLAEYQDDIAYRYGKERFVDLTQKQRNEARAAFAEGRADEKRHQ